METVRRASRQKEFEREFRKHIEAHRAALVRVLRKLISTRPPPKVKILSFEILSSWREFPVHVHAMDDKAPNEVYFKPPFSMALLQDAGELIPKGAIDQEAFENAGLATFE